MVAMTVIPSRRRVMVAAAFTMSLVQRTPRVRKVLHRFDCDGIEQQQRRRTKQLSQSEAT